MPGAGRVVGLDVARCLALLGMVTTHLVDERSADGSLTFGQWLAGGRSSALFAVLAGVSLALMSGGTSPVSGRERRARTAGLLARALLVAVLGLVLALADSGLAVILTYYGLLFALGTLFLGLRTRALVVLAGVWVVVVPLLSRAVRPHLPERGFASPSFDQLGDPGHLLSELLLTGYYPVLPWLAYLLVGLALGRADLRSPRVAVVALGVGALLAVGVAAFAPVPSDVATGMFGNVPADGSWSWLRVAAPHSSTPPDLAGTIGSSLVVIGGCLLVVGRLHGAALEAVRVFFGAGAMTLTLYSLHVLLRTDRVWPDDRAASYLLHVVTLLAIGSVFAALRWRGPLERVVSAAADGVTRRTGRR